MLADPGDLVEDDLLRLVLMCTHPALDPAAASALALRLVLGVSTADIARLFLVPEPTMAARVTRAKRKIVTAGIPFAVPSSATSCPTVSTRCRPDRLPRLHRRLRARIGPRRPAHRPCGRGDPARACRPRAATRRAGTGRPARADAAAALAPRRPRRRRRRGSCSCPTRTGRAGTATRSPRRWPSRPVAVPSPDRSPSRPPGMPCRPGSRSSTRLRRPPRRPSGTASWRATTTSWR